MENVIQFTADNWEVIMAAILWLVARLIPTKKNYDVIEMALKFIGKLLPNKRVDSLGNKIDDK